MVKQGRVLTVQMGQARVVRAAGRTVTTAIYKSPVHGMVQVRAVGLVGDEQADRTVHGGLNKAVYAYPSEHYPYWQSQREAAGVVAIDGGLPFGSMGENLTLEGLLEEELWIGDVLALPDCSLRVTKPREPCFKFNLALGFSTAAKAMVASGFCGFYLAVDTPGTLQSGDTFTVLPGPRQVRVDQRFAAMMGR